MKFSETLIPTLKETPAEAEVVSHKLMLRGGFIRKLAAGVYIYLPLGLRVIKKVEQIVREEMTSAGAQELLLPIVMPAELWQKTGRWNYYGKELLRFKDRGDREFCIGPTHEEAITDLAVREIKSYRDMPKNLFQIQTKFRDEIRPRFGLMRGREFIMKDSYSFDIDEDHAHVSYKKMYDAYCKIFKRCGFDFRPVEAATGAIGGTLSHEFQAIAESGEDPIFFCDKCDYAASMERARTVKEEELKKMNEEAKAEVKAEVKVEEVKTPGKKTVEEVSSFLGIKPNELIKTLLYKVKNFDEKYLYVAALVLGSDEIIEPKLVRALFESGIIGTMDVQLELADEEDVIKLTNAPVGFAGPVGLSDSVVIVADTAIYGDKKYVTGANKNDTHLKGVRWEDCRIAKFVDIRRAKEGDVCHVKGCKGHLKERRGIEVGQVFYLGTKYSEKMRAVYLDANGKEQLMIMGCYGIGISRTAAAAIEQHNDEKGMIWPMSIAPAACHLISLSGTDERVAGFAEEVYCKLQESGIEVLYDDRDARPGVKFADADLIGIPYQVIVGSKSIGGTTLEIKDRRSGKKENWSLDHLISTIKKEMSDACQSA